MDTKLKNTLSAIVYTLLLLCAAALFAVVMWYGQGTSGETEGGSGIFGSGSGDGVGGSTGDSKDTGGQTPSDERPPEGASEEKNEPAEEQAGEEKADGGQKPSDPTPDKPEKPEKPEKKPAEVPPEAEPIKLPGSQEPQPREKEDPADAPSGEKGSFSSGGRSVFRIRKNESVLFVIDISGSMYAPTAERLSRWEVLKIQLLKAVKQQCELQSKGKYSLLVFNQQVQHFPDDPDQMQLRFNSADDRSKLEKYLHNRRPGGNTFLLTAMTEAVERINEKKLKVDVIIVLSDGAPSDCANPEIYAALLKKLPARVKVHTISVGIKSPLLQKIAEAGGGKYDEYR